MTLVCFVYMHNKTHHKTKSCCACMILSMLIEGSRHDADDVHLHVVFSLFSFFLHCQIFFFVVVIIIRRRRCRLLFSWLVNYHNNSDDGLNDTRSFSFYVYIYQCVCDQISKGILSIHLIWLKQKEKKDRKSEKKKTFCDLLILIICSLY